VQGIQVDVTGAKRGQFGPIAGLREGAQQARARGTAGSIAAAQVVDFSDGQGLGRLRGLFLSSAFESGRGYGADDPVIDSGVENGL